MGFLNPAEDDDYRISQMAGTTEVPAPGAFQGLLTAVPKGLTSAGVKLSSMVEGISSGIEHSLTGGAYQGDFGGDLLAHPNYLQVDVNDPTQRLPGFAGQLQTGVAGAMDKAAAATKVAADWAATGQDPRQTGVVGRIAAGTTEGISIGAAGAAVAGPWGAATLLGGTYGHSTYLEAKQNGVDDKTALEQATIVGGFSAASAFLPMTFGKTALTSVVGGAGLNVGFGAAQRLATSTVLKANGYDDMAKQYRVFDGEAMAADLVLGAAFGGMGHAFRGHEVSPADVDAAAAVATEDHYNRSAPGVPTDPEAANLHNETMADSLRRMADGDLPDIAPDVAQKLVDNVLPDPIHSLASGPEPMRSLADVGTIIDNRLSALDTLAEGVRSKQDLTALGKESADLEALLREQYAANEKGVLPSGDTRLTPEELQMAQDRFDAIRSEFEQHRQAVGAKNTATRLREKLAGIDDDRRLRELADDLHPEPKTRVREPSPLEQAAHEELPGFAEAAADVPRQELPPETVPPPREEPAPAPAKPGEPAKEPDVPLDDYHQSQLDHLVHNMGDEKIVTDDGREVSIRELADEMQQQRNEAKKFGVLHEVAAACAARNGF